MKLLLLERQEKFLPFVRQCKNSTMQYAVVVVWFRASRYNVKFLRSAARPRRPSAMIHRLPQVRSPKVVDVTR